MSPKESQPLFFIRYETIRENSAIPIENELLTLEEVAAKIPELHRLGIDTSKIVIIDSGNEINQEGITTDISRRFFLNVSGLLLRNK
ncbi:hypothetical protein [Leptospira sp. id769339]|uniref:hypothetical protein n=1 Tax=Leptospira sp. id769339 TaxID=2864221 RepID=UPI00214B4BB4|nr:hypothetical protein [Leptospira sp. id769339]MCR1795374.1 hypothetical protein [Leptospira sp. id769339]